MRPSIRARGQLIKPAMAGGCGRRTRINRVRVRTAVFCTCVHTRAREGGPRHVAISIIE